MYFGKNCGFGKTVDFDFGHDHLTVMMNCLITDFFQDHLSFVIVNCLIIGFFQDHL